MAKSKKPTKFEATLPIDKKMDQILKGLEYTFSVMVQERITEVFVQDGKKFRDFCNWISSEQGTEYLDKAGLSSAYLLKQILIRCMSQFEDDVRNGTSSSFVDTAEYYFQTSQEIIDHSWGEFNQLK